MKRFIFAIAGIFLLVGAYLLGSWHGFSAGLGRGMEFVRHTHLRLEFAGLYDNLSSRNPAPQAREYFKESIYYLSTVMDDRDIGSAMLKDFEAKDALGRNEVTQLKGGKT